MNERGNRKSVIGMVVSDKMQKTISVRVERLVQHPKYNKFIRRWTTFKAHDENSEAHHGDTVEIAETRPLSKMKRWRLVRVVSKKEKE
jgi:small subunit ribosomal protein S17